MPRDLKTECHISFHFELVGKTKEIKRCVDDGSVEDTFWGFFEEHLKDTKIAYWCNSVVVKGSDVYINIGNSKKKKNYDKFVTSITEYFNKWFKVDKKNDFKGITLVLVKYSVDKTPKELQKEIKIPGYIVEDVEYCDYDEGFDDISILVKKDIPHFIKSKKSKAITPEKRSDKLPRYYQIIVEGESNFSTPDLYYIKEDEMSKKYLKSLEKYDNDAWYRVLGAKYDGEDDVDEDIYMEEQDKVRDWFIKNNNVDAEKINPKVIVKVFTYSS